MTRRYPPPIGVTRKATDETLRAEYQEVCNSHLAITDFRGKLLGLLPIASGTGIFLLLDKPIKTPDTTFTTFLVAAGIFGAAVTIGLFSYEYGGMRECHRLRECGKNLERKLKLESHCSRFQNTQPGLLGPPEAGVIVYFAVVAAWIFVFFHGLVSPNLKLERKIAVIIIICYAIVVVAAVPLIRRAIAAAENSLVRSGRNSKVLKIGLDRGNYRMRWTTKGRGYFGITQESGSGSGGSGSGRHLVSAFAPDTDSGEVIVCKTESGRQKFGIDANGLDWMLEFTLL